MIGIFAKVMIAAISKEMLIYAVIHRCLERCLVNGKINRNFSTLGQYRRHPLEEWIKCYKSRWKRLDRRSDIGHLQERAIFFGSPFLHKKYSGEVHCIIVFRHSPQRSRHCPADPLL